MIFVVNFGRTYKKFINIIKNFIKNFIFLLKNEFFKFSTK